MSGRQRASGLGSPCSSGAPFRCDPRPFATDGVQVRCPCARLPGRRFCHSKAGMNVTTSHILESPLPSEMSLVGQEHLLVTIKRIQPHIVAATAIPGKGDLRKFLSDALIASSGGIRMTPSTSTACWPGAPGTPFVRGRPFSRRHWSASPSTTLADFPLGVLRPAFHNEDGALVAVSRRRRGWLARRLAWLVAGMVRELFLFRFAALRRRDCRRRRRRSSFQSRLPIFRHPRPSHAVGIVGPDLWQKQPQPHRDRHLARGQRYRDQRLTIRGLAQR